MNDYTYSSTSFKRWADKRRSDPLLIEDANKAARWTPPKIEKKPEEKKPASSRRGRPELNTPNPVASYMHLLSYDRPQWVDAIVYGSTATGAGASKGQLNVKPCFVLAALHLETFSTETVKTGDMSIRAAQTIAKAARHTAHGIDCYLARHPKIKARLAIEMATE